MESCKLLSRKDYNRLSGCVPRGLVIGAVPITRQAARGSVQEEMDTIMGSAAVGLTWPEWCSRIYVERPE